jgi:hypothetical protein
LGTLVAVVLGGCVLGGCAGQSANAPSPALPAPTPKVTSPTPVGHRLGETLSASNGVDATVYAYTQSIDAGAAAIDVQACGAKTSVFDVSVSSAPWTLLLADGASVRSTTGTFPQLPDPRYPDLQISLKPGDCIRGWIVFALPAGSRPVLAQYAPPSSSPSDWTIG